MKHLVSFFVHCSHSVYLLITVGTKAIKVLREVTKT